MPMVWSLSQSQTEFEERVRTLGIGVTAIGVLGFGLYFFRPALLPLVLAVALKHLLEPVIYVFSVRPLVCCGRTILSKPLACQGNRERGKRAQSFCDYACRLQLPRSIAICVALLIAFVVLGLLAAIVADSVKVFADHADMYAHQLKVILGRILGWIEYFSCKWTPSGCPGNETGANATSGNATDPAHAAGNELEKLLSSIPLSDLVLHTVEAFLELCSNLFVVLLFTVYLLLGKHDPQPSAVDQQILSYIKGKVALSAFIGFATAIVLLAVGLDLWLVFGSLAFWLNFVPNVGAVVAVFLPMPLVILDPQMSTAAMVLAFALPFGVHMFVGNVLEPLLFGHSLELQPVVILLSLMVWGMLWGVIGMVLAVPMTAVLKIHLTYIDHPVADYLVRLLVGHGAKEQDEDGGGVHGRHAMQPVAEDTLLPLRGSGADGDASERQVSLLRGVEGSSAPAGSVNANGGRAGDGIQEVP
jgi:predicted PurR-regulated permease PerM